MHPGAPSLWIEEAASGAAQPLSEHDHSCDVLVVGCGLTGASAALWLAEAGHDVLLVEAHGPGHGASARSGGFLLVEHAIEYPARRERFGAQTMRTIIEMARANHCGIENRFAAAAEHKRCGSLILPMSDDAEEIAALQHAAQLLRDDGVDCEDGVTHRHADGFAPGVFIPEDGEVHPGRLLSALATAATQAGTRIRQGLVTEIDPARRSARVGSHTISYGSAIVAVNAWTSRLLPDIPITPQRAQMLATAPCSPTRQLGPVCYAGWGYDYFRQREDGRVLLGGRRNVHRDSEATDDSTPTAPVQASLDEYLARHLSTLGPFEIEARWSGIMGFSPDELPFYRALETTHVIGGMTGHGMGLGAICGETMARLATHALTPAFERYRAVLDARRLA